jgi:hypothetical protein
MITHHDLTPHMTLTIRLVSEGMAWDLQQLQHSLTAETVI